MLNPDGLRMYEEESADMDSFCTYTSDDDGPDKNTGGSGGGNSKKSTDDDHAGGGDKSTDGHEPGVADDESSSR